MAVVVALESMGVPVPGETTLVSAAIFAGTTHRLNIWLVIAAAALGAIAGDSVGYAIGRTLGHRFLINHGALLRMDARRIKLGQYLFKRHGGKVVFFGRFVALLRALAALLAGIRSGTFADADEAVARSVRARARVEPVWDYDEQYRRFRSLYPTLNEIDEHH